MARLRRPLCIHWYYVNYSQHVCWHWRVAILSAFAAQVPQLRPNLSIWNGGGRARGEPICCLSMRRHLHTQHSHMAARRALLFIWFNIRFIYLVIYLEASCWQESCSRVDRRAQRKDKDCEVLIDTHTHTPSREIHRCELARALREGRQASLVFCLNHRHEFMKENMEGGWMLSVFKWKRPLKGLVVH